MARGRGGFIGQDGLNAPDSPTAVSGTAGDQQVSVAFTAPTDVGGSAITGFRAQSNTGIGASGTSSPITVTGLSNGTSYTFNVWAINAFGYSAPSDASTGVSPVQFSRGLFAGGEWSGGSSVNIIDYITIASTGNATDFGDLDQARYGSGGFSSSTRGVFAGGYASSDVNKIQYVTIASTGNASDFGDLLANLQALPGALSSSVRGVIGGGYEDSGGTNRIQYVTIASTGNATDFGDLTASRWYLTGTSSPTRGLFAGGNSSNVTIDYITIASTGNATDFGDLISGGNDGGQAGASNGTRAVFGGNSTPSNQIDYVTIASTGNASDFGNLTTSRGFAGGTSATGVDRAVFGAGGSGGSGQNTVDYVTVSTTGNASDFGDLTAARASLGACSSAHGGLS